VGARPVRLEVVGDWKKNLEKGGEKSVESKRPSYISLGKGRGLGERIVHSDVLKRLGL